MHIATCSVLSACVNEKERCLCKNASVAFGQCCTLTWTSVCTGLAISCTSTRTTTSDSTTSTVTWSKSQNAQSGQQRHYPQHVPRYQGLFTPVQSLAYLQVVTLVRTTTYVLNSLVVLAVTQHNIGCSPVLSTSYTPVLSTSCSEEEQERHSQGKQCVFV